MYLYDALSSTRACRDRILSPRELGRASPASTPTRSTAPRCSTTPVRLAERLAIENVIDAAEHGALRPNYTEVIGAIHEGDGWAA